jgi:hypothetical protein
MGSIQLASTSESGVPQSALLTGVTVTEDPATQQPVIDLGANPGTSYYSGIAPQLVDGLSAAPIAVPTLAVTDVIVLTLRTAAGSALGIPSPHTIVAGTPGSFGIISKSPTDQSTVTGDLSVYNWIVVPANPPA